MADADDEFEVKLGRIGHRKERSGKPYLARVRRAVETAAAPRSGRGALFTGGRIGRGGALGVIRATSSGRPSLRRVVVKARFVRIKGGDAGTMRAHLRYVQRDGVSPDGTPGRLYDAAGEDVDGAAFAGRCTEDRHQFRFIVAPEDSAELADLKPFVRDLMRQMEADLGTKLDWAAADHFNTGHPHSHIVVRGRDDRGRDLIIARDYIAYGLRGRACELVTRELGPETERERLQKLEREVGAERLTRIDRAILRDVDSGVLKLAAHPERDPAREALRMGRLRVLERMGLATEAEPSIWRIKADMEQMLRRMGERGDIIKTMHREFRAAGLERAPGDAVIFDAERPESQVIGRMFAMGLSDELHDRWFVIIDGIDGRSHYVELGVSGSVEQLDIQPGMIVDVRGRDRSGPAIDRAVGEIAASHGGTYSAALHRQADPAASEPYLAAHVRRLEAMRRAGLVERMAEGTWQVGIDFAARAERYEIISRQRNPVRITVLSWQPLEALPETLGATWLDRRLLSGDADRGTSGFAEEVGRALQRRQQWLIAQGLAAEAGKGIRFQPGLLNRLEQRELADAGRQLSAQTGLERGQVLPGEPIAGRYRMPVVLASGRYAMIERAHDFVLVPWRPVLEQARGQWVQGAGSGNGISWSIGRTRGVGL